MLACQALVLMSDPPLPVPPGPPQLAPEPPYQLHVLSKFAEYAFAWVQTAVCLGSFWYAIVVGRRGRTAIPFMCMIGGALTIFLEPLIDSHLQVWWPIHYQPDVLTVWGRNVPLMILPVVAWYFGLNAAMRYRWMQKNGPATKLWKLYAIEVACALALEPPAIQLDLWHYYGNHGLRIFGYPVWWPFVGGACCMAAGTLVFLLAPYLRGPRVLLTAPIVVMGVCAAYWGAGWPMFTVLNIEAPTWMVLPASALSIAFSFLIVWVCTIGTGHHEFLRARREARKAGLPEHEPATAGV
jgi:hypothetical protein